MAFRWFEQVYRRFPWIELGGISLLKMGRPVLFTSLTLTGIILGLRYVGWMETVELTVYDHYIRRQPDLGEDPRLTVVGIDESDLQTLEEWPLSDRSLANLLAKLETYQPRVIAIDIYRDLPIEPGRDELLAQLQQIDNVVIICRVSSVGDMGTPPPPTVPSGKVGFADLVVDPGGILRRNLLMQSPPRLETPFPKAHLCNNPGNTLLSLGFRSALTYLKAEGISPTFTPEGNLQLGTAILPPMMPGMGGYHRADTGGYQILLQYRSENQAVAQVNLMSVLEGTVDPALIRDRIVMVGYTSPQAKDDFYTPYSARRNDKQKMPGIVVHAQATSQVLSAALDQRPLIWVWPVTTEVLWIFGWSLLGGVLAWYLRHPGWFALVILAGGGTIYGTGLLVFLQQGWIPVVPPALTFVTTAVGVVLLDRFNNSAYGQTIYRKVKTFLKLDIEIDEENLQKQVSEITETDYFRDLQDSVKSLRQRSDNPPVQDSLPSPNHPTPTLSCFNDSSEHPSPKHPRLENDDLGDDSYALDNYKLDNYKLDKHDVDDYELDYIGQLQAAAQALKSSAMADPPPLPQPLSEDDHLILDDAFCRHEDTSQATQDYIALLDQEIHLLKSQIH